MGDRTKIEWSDATWNPIVGCSLVSPGCTNCYAMRAAYRIERASPSSHYAGTTRCVNGQAVWSGDVKIAPAAVFEQPLRWRRPRRIFVNSMGDLFHEDVPTPWIDRVFALIASCPQHTFQILTKRSARMRDYICRVADERDEDTIRRNALAVSEARLPTTKVFEWPLPNCWLGVSAEDQMRADARIPDLLRTPAAVRFVSAEPLLGVLDLLQAVPSEGAWHWLTGACDIGGERTWTPKIDWVIAGGESGPGSRPMNPEWARSLRDQCTASSTPFFFKQFGDFAPVSSRQSLVARSDKPLTIAHLQNSAFLAIGRDGLSGEYLHRVGKKNAGRLLDGAFHDAWPDTSRPPEASLQ